MNRVYDLLNAIENGRFLFEEIMGRESSCDFQVEEIYGDFSCGADSRPEEWEEGINLMASGDNLDFLEYLIKKKKMSGKLQLVYLDPPFFSNSKYQASVRLESAKLGRSKVIKTGAYDDRWEDSLEQYLSMLAVRLYLIRELLSDTGCIWVHLDWHGSHYVKMLMDEIFGENNFVNEVIWLYKSGGASKKSFARKHDCLLFYSKSKRYKFNILREKSYNRDMKPYRFKGVEEFQDKIGWYTKVNMKDVWYIDMVGRTSSERTGYATQKPEKLLERIVKACSDPGDLCADFFSGSGTMAAVCSKLDRKWIMCDEGEVAIGSQILRLGGAKADDEKREPFALARKSTGNKDEMANGCVAFTEELGCLRLAYYKPAVLELSEEDEDIAEQYISDDGMSTVNFWSIDRDYDGKVHKSSDIITKDDFCICQTDRYHIIGYDVFGNRFQWQKKV